MERPDKRPPRRKCPICGKLVAPDAEHYPFCSARCKTIDLGAWSAEEYVVSRPLTEADEELQPPDQATDRPQDE